MSAIIWDAGADPQFIRTRVSLHNQERLRRSLRKSTTLKTFVLGFTRLTEAIIDELCELFEQNKTITALGFLSAEFTNAGLSKVLMSLSQNTTLTSIMLMQSRLTDAVVPDLCKFLQVNKVMEDIRFHQDHFTDAGFSRILKSLCKKRQTLQELEIKESKLTDAVVPDICRFLEVNKVMTCLQLHKATLTDTGFARILRSLCENSTLNIFAIWESPLTDAVVNDFCTFLEVNKVIVDLQFQQAKFTDAGFSKMLQALCTNSSLHHLSIKHSALTDAVMDDMCHFLDTNKTLGCLQFYRSRFTDSRLSRMLQSLCRNSSMRSLAIHESKLTDAVLVDLCKFLEVNTTLMCLQFYEALFTDAGFSQVLQFLSRNSTLSSIGIHKSKLTDAVINDLCRFLQVNKSMIRLSFYQDHFSDAGFSQILQCLCRDSTLHVLTIQQTTLTDAVIKDLCRFLQLNKVMTHLRLGEPRFTEAGLAKLLQSIFTGSTLKLLALQKSRLTDAIVVDMCRFLEANKVMAELEFDEAVFTDPGFSVLLESFRKDTTLQVVRVTDFIDDRAVQPLVEFVELRKDVAAIRSIKRGQTVCLMILRRSPIHMTSYYFIITVNGQVKILRRSECLQTQLKDFLIQHAVPSAIDIKKNELILFVQKDGGHKFLRDLNEEMKNIDVNFVNTCKVEPLEGPFEFEFHDDDEKCCPGAGVCFTDSSDKELYSSVGAILKDDRERLFFISTLHGNVFKKCHIINNKEITCKCIAEVHQMSPLLDACLIEVTVNEGESKCSPTLPIPYIESALCGPYTGPTEDLVTKYQSGLSSIDKYTLVRKYGDATQLTGGVLVYSHFSLPEKGITDALLIRPNSGIGSFTEGGDSGAAIFSHFPCDSKDTYTALCYKGLAFTCGGVSVNNRKATVATRLDLVIKHFEKELNTKLYLLDTHTCVLAVLLRKFWEMNCGGTQKPTVVE